MLSSFAPKKKVWRDKGLGNAQIRNFPETQNDSEERDDGSREWGIIQDISITIVGVEKSGRYHVIS